MSCLGESHLAIYSQWNADEREGLWTRNPTARSAQPWHIHLGIESLDMEFLRCDDHARPHQPNPMEDILGVDGIGVQLCASHLFFLSGD